MDETLRRKADKRVIFRPGEQQRFLTAAIKNLQLSENLFLDKIKVNRRTFNDWKRGKYSLPLCIFQKICKLAKLKTPSKIEIRKPFWSVKKAAKIGGKLVYQRYGIIGGDPKRRKQKWLEWWEKVGRFNVNEHFTAKKINLPQKNTELAEFAGIMMGDGGITKRQVIVTLSYKTDGPYSIFVANTIRKLFQVEPSIYNRKDESVINIVVSRTRLVSFCESIGLKIGNKLKQKLDIPRWVMQNQFFRIACVRGLIDTDGRIFQECHKINGKKYCYPRLIFTSYSKRLCSSVVKILKEFGFSPRIRVGRSVQLEDKSEIIKYFKLIGTNNQHHRKRFEFFYGGVG